MSGDRDAQERCVVLSHEFRRLEDNFEAVLRRHVSPFLSTNCLSREVSLCLGEYQAEPFIEYI